MKIILAFLLLTLVSPTYAAEWVRVHTSGVGDQYFYDRTKLYINGDEITYWKKVNFRNAQPVKNSFAASGLFRERIHCTEHTLKLISYLLYAADGGTIDYVAANEGEPAPIIPDTLGDMYEKIVCELVRQKHDEQRRKQAEEPKNIELEKGEMTSELPAATRPAAQDATTQSAQKNNGTETVASPPPPMKTELEPSLPIRE